MIKRIKSLISVKNLTASQFADLLGVQRSNISHILSGRNKPSLDFILKITEHFPNVSIDWLINGKGEMFASFEKGKLNIPTQLEILSLETDLKEENVEITAPNSGISIGKEQKESILEGSSNAFSDIKKEEMENDNYSSIVPKQDDIEQIMVLYKNGSFRVYKPQQ